MTDRTIAEAVRNMAEMTRTIGDAPWMADLDRLASEDTASSLWMAPKDAPIAHIMVGWVKLNTNTSAFHRFVEKRANGSWYSPHRHKDRISTKTIICVRHIDRPWRFLRDLQFKEMEKNVRSKLSKKLTAAVMAILRSRDLDLTHLSSICRQEMAIQGLSEMEIERVGQALRFTYTNPPLDLANY